MRATQVTHAVSTMLDNEKIPAQHRSKAQVTPWSLLKTSVFTTLASTVKAADAAVVAPGTALLGGSAMVKPHQPDANPGAVQMPRRQLASTPPYSPYDTYYLTSGVDGKGKNLVASWYHGANNDIVLEARANKNDQWYGIAPNTAGQGYVIQLLNNADCLDLAGGKYTAGTEVIPTTCQGTSGTNTQAWNLSPSVVLNGLQFYTISPAYQPKGTSLCLDVKNSNQSPGTTIQVFTCNKTPAQNWAFWFAAPLAVQVYVTSGVNGGAENLVLGYPNGVGKNILLEDYDNLGDNEIFNVSPDGVISDINSQNCLDLAGGKYAAGTEVVLNPCSNSATQFWLFKPSVVINNVQFYTVSPANQPNGANLCLDDKSSGENPGNIIQIWTCNKTGAQNFNVNNAFD